MVCIVYCHFCMPLAFHSLLSLFDLGLFEQGSHFMLNRFSNLTLRRCQFFFFTLSSIELRIFLSIAPNNYPDSFLSLSFFLPPPFSLFFEEKLLVNTANVPIE